VGAPVASCLERTLVEVITKSDEWCASQSSDCMISHGLMHHTHMHTCTHQSSTLKRRASLLPQRA
jgi:hypothetical protein